MFPRAAKWLVVLTLTLSLGLHWAFLQSVAWIGMVVSYSQTTSLHQALKMTFDGQHPCQLCKLVRHGKASEKEQESQKSVAKLDYWLVSDPSAFIAPRLHAPVAIDVTFLLPRVEPPPTPPPRPV